METEILDIILEKDDITWQTLIYDLVKSDKMDPWNVDVSILTKRYIGMIKKLKEHDFRISGKIVLAAAILLKIKSRHLMNEGMNNLDTLIHGIQEEEDLFFEEYFHEFGEEVFIKDEKYTKEPLIVPKTPLPRSRKVSVYDLVKALEKALEVENRRNLRRPAEHPEVKVPKKIMDVTVMIKELYNKIRGYFNQDKQITFDQLIPSDSREDKIYTFIPLLHLTTQRKIDLYQPKHFGEIFIQPVKNK